MPPSLPATGSGQAIPPSVPGGVAGEPSDGRMPQSAARLAALRGRTPPPGAVTDAAAGQHVAFDAIHEIAALAAGQEGRGMPRPPAGGLAEALLDFVAPVLAHPERLTPGRIVAELELAALALDDAPADDTIAALGARALRQELERHRDLAERRGRLIEG